MFALYRLITPVAPARRELRLSFTETVGSILGLSMGACMRWVTSIWRISARACTRWTGWLASLVAGGEGQQRGGGKICMQPPAQGMFEHEGLRGSTARADLGDWAVAGVVACTWVSASAPLACPPCDYTEDGVHARPICSNCGLPTGACLLCGCEYYRTCSCRQEPEIDAPPPRAEVEAVRCRQCTRHAYDVCTHCGGVYCAACGWTTCSCDGGWSDGNACRHAAAACSTCGQLYCRLCGISFGCACGYETEMLSLWSKSVSIQPLGLHASVSIRGKHLHASVSMPRQAARLRGGGTEHTAWQWLGDEYRDEWLRQEPVPEVGVVSVLGLDQRARRSN